MPEEGAATINDSVRDAAHEHIERGIEAAERGDLAAALEELAEAESLAVDLNAPDIAAAALINMGYAYWASGDAETARKHYAEGADIARSADDVMRLKSALTNFGTASRQVGRSEEAVIAYDELLALEGLEPAELAAAQFNCGLAHIEMGGFVEGLSHLAEAERLALDSGMIDLAITAVLDQGMATERIGDSETATELYARAAEMARELEDTELLAVAVASQAYAHRMNYYEADPLFTEAESLYRSLGMRAELANTLYWHAATLKIAGMRDAAVATWREEEIIRRSLEQHVELGDCLLGQASVLREREEWFALEGLYPQAAEAFEQGGSSAGLSETRLLQARLSRIQGRPQEALSRSEAGLNAAIAADLKTTECRLRGLRAMLLAETGDPAKAIEELDAATATSMGAGLAEQATWALARRAYVMAHEGKTPEQVALQLQAAYKYGTENDLEALGKRAALRMIAEIKDHCGDEYAERLSELRAELRASAKSGSAQPTGSPSSDGNAPDLQPPVDEVEPALSAEDSRDDDSE